MPAEHSLTAWTVSQTIDFLKSGQKEPFAVTCSILHPHAPLVVSEPYASMFDPAEMPMPDTLDDGNHMPHRRCVPDPVSLTPEGLGAFIALYCGLVKEIDDWMGRLLAALDESGMSDRTLVVFTSDHGEMMGDHGTFSKMCFYEASMRVPLIYRLPGVIPAGTRVESATSGADLLPTVFDLLGLPVPSDVHGRSLKPELVGEPGARGGEFAYSELATGRAIRSAKWKYAETTNTGDFLFDLESDPKELRNLLAPKHATPATREIAARLKATMHGMLEGWGMPVGPYWPQPRGSGD